MHTRISLLALLCLPLCSCVGLDEPLGSPHDAKPDESLVGAWIKREDDATHVLVIGKCATPMDKQEDAAALPPGIMSYQVASLGKDGVLQEQSSPPLFFFTTKIGRDSYLNLFDSKSAEVVDGKWGLKRGTELFIVKYRIQGGALECWTLDAGKVKAAVANGQLTGVIKKGFITQVMVRDTARLRNLLAKDDSLLVAAPTEIARRIPAE